MTSSEVTTNKRKNDNSKKGPKQKRPNFYLNNIYGDPNDPKDFDEPPSAINYGLVRDGTTYYFHPMSESCVLFPEDESNLVHQKDPSYWEIYHNQLNIKPYGPCLHCDENFDSCRIPLPKDYEERRKRYVVWGNFCSFSCAMRYEMEHPSYDSSWVLMLLRRMAEDIFNFHEEVLPAAPRILTKKYGGHIEQSNLSRIGKQYNLNLRESSFVSYAMMVECQPRDPKELNEISSKQIKPFRPRGLRPPKNIEEFYKKNKMKEVFSDHSLYEEFMREENNKKKSSSQESSQDLTKTTLHNKNNQEENEELSISTPKTNNVFGNNNNNNRKKQKTNKRNKIQNTKSIDSLKETTIESITNEKLNTITTNSKDDIIVFQNQNDSSLKNQNDKIEEEKENKTLPLDISNCSLESLFTKKKKVQ